MGPRPVLFLRDFIIAYVSARGSCTIDELLDALERSRHHFFILASRSETIREVERLAAMGVLVVDGKLIRVNTVKLHPIIAWKAGRVAERLRAAKVLDAEGVVQEEGGGHRG